MALWLVYVNTVVYIQPKSRPGWPNARFSWNNGIHTRKRNPNIRLEPAKPEEPQEFFDNE